MKRIFITGNAGSGKTTLAAAVAAHTGLPCVGLDNIVWQPGWKKTPGAERRRQEEAIAAEAAWVVDGVSEVLLTAADTVVFLDVPRYRCYWRALRRNLPYLFRSRPGLPEGCPEVLIIPELVKIIWLFPARVRPAILEVLQAGGKRHVFHVRSNRDLRDFKSALQASIGSNTR